MAKPALGRGLGALLGGTPIAKPSAPVPVLKALQDGPAHVTRERAQRLTLGSVRPCPLQPRKEFSEEALPELADSIREQGIVQPLIVRERNSQLELIAGER